MPMHDWRKIEAGLYHGFHTWWVTTIADVLNNGALPKHYYAIPEQVTSAYIPDVVTLGKRESAVPQFSGTTPAVELLDHGRLTKRLRKHNRITINHISGDKVIAIIEVVSPANKDSKQSCNDFTNKAVETIASGINFLYVDPFKPTNQDHHGLHSRIWHRLFPKKTSYHATENKPLMAVSYACLDNDEIHAIVERFAVDDLLPEMPLCVDGIWITVHLEEAYSQAWARYPQEMKERLL